MNSENKNTANSNFKLKDVGQTTRILTQNENGPCPLLALANILLLRGDIVIRKEQQSISFDALVELLGDYLVRKSSTENLKSENNSTESLPGGEGGGNLNLMQAITLLPTLRDGLDINVTFDSVFGLKILLLWVFSRLLEWMLVMVGYLLSMIPLMLHNLLNLNHLKEEEVLAVFRILYKKNVGKVVGIGGFSELRSYNQLLEALVDAEIAATELSGLNDSAISDMTRESETLSLDNYTTTTTEKGKTKNAPALEKRMTLGSLAQSFLSSTSTQLTPTGLTQLTKTLAPNSLAILFRNNHFSTLHHHPQLGLFTLVTDEGFLTKKCVWESLTVDGDCVFVDAEFGFYVASASDQALDGGGGQVNLDDVDVSLQERAWKAIVDGEVVDIDGGGGGGGSGGQQIGRCRNEEDRLARSRQQSEQNSQSPAAITGAPQRIAPNSANNSPRPPKPVVPPTPQKKQQRQEEACVVQ
ncbi:hypothetical protein BDR26DRAFT_1011730 [Obelidium mucronatum]|nr:hypothetical protein BDR26DRAFT_1011730 [Obelidium mucronatum]